MTTSLARLMNCEGLARTIIADAAPRATDLARRTGVTPTLATVLVGDDPASVTYVRMKRRRCEQAGIGSRHIGLPYRPPQHNKPPEHDRRFPRDFRQRNSRPSQPKRNSGTS